jgi:hypothetical protein
MEDQFLDSQTGVCSSCAAREEARRLSRTIPNQVSSASSNMSPMSYGGEMTVCGKCRKEHRSLIKGGLCSACKQTILAEAAESEARAQRRSEHYARQVELGTNEPFKEDLSPSIFSSAKAKVYLLIIGFAIIFGGFVFSVMFGGGSSGPKEDAWYQAGAFAHSKIDGMTIREIAPYSEAGVTDYGNNFYSVSLPMKCVVDATGIAVNVIYNAKLRKDGDRWILEESNAGLAY